LEGRKLRIRGKKHGLKPVSGQVSFSFLSWLTVAAILLLWYFVTARGWVSAFVRPSPADLWSEFLVLVAKGYAGKTLSEHVLASLFRTFTGLGLGIAIGVPLGLLMGPTPSWGRSFPSSGPSRPSPSFP
jgi:ABC-type nitrate/sulfonate/bicarbonate transport system permease component